MDTKIYTTIDRVAAGWPSGEWDSEPDKMQWPDDATGLPCLAVRNPHSGHWCGYVGVAPGHPLHGKDYNEPDLDVHGGLTFAGACGHGTDESVGICHTPARGEPDTVWWLGFDCHHAWDVAPLDVKYANERGYPFTIQDDAHYRTLDYVRQECARLAAQVAQAAIGTA